MISQTTRIKSLQEEQSNKINIASKPFVVLNCCTYTLYVLLGIK